MKSLKLDLTDCYGIASLDAKFDYSKANTNVVYASNGSMKTSLSNTFKRLAQKKEPEEKIHGRKPVAHVHMDGKPILSDSIFVIEPFDEAFSSKSMSTLLVNPEMKAEYDSIFEAIASERAKLVIQLNKLSKVKKDDVESSILRDFNAKNLFELLGSIESEIQTADDFGTVPYSVVFDPKVLEVLAQEKVAENFKAYIEKYNQLVDSVGYYSKGGFSPIKADNVVKSLDKEKYFEAKNSLNLNGQTSPIVDSKSLQATIEADKAKILGNPELKKIGELVIASVASVKTFQELLENNAHLAGQLSDVESLRTKLWLSYFRTLSDHVLACVVAYTTGRARIKEIEERANIEKTRWFDVKSIFKQRFDLPFEIGIQDQVNTILGTTTPNITFSFIDDRTGTAKPFSKEGIQSLGVLSQGEKRALYLLYVIFEVESRRAQKLDTLFVVDDIADSFDYRNKYAIIEYLKDMNEESFFRLLILSHNFDFFRTIQSRILSDQQWENSFIAVRDQGKVSLVRGGDKSTTNPFDFWKKNLGTNPSMLVACIPFVRNLVEFKEGGKHQDYSTLTSLLHMKILPDTHAITLGDLQNVFGKYLHGIDLEVAGRESEKVFDVIIATADAIVAATKVETAEIEIKVALSIAVRLLAETFMWKNVADTTPISGNQTGRLFDRFKTQHGTDPSKQSVLRLLGGVNLMTPENIHLNSFMYEPILDMSNHHLIDLYRKVKAL